MDENPYQAPQSMPIPGWQADRARPIFRPFLVMLVAFGVTILLVGLVGMAVIVATWLVWLGWLE